MDPIQNPYAPGAGTPPPSLMGRDQLLRQADILFARTLAKKPEKSIIMTGLRGVGKTVLLNKMEQMAMERGYRCISIECTVGKSLSETLTPQLRRYLFELDRMEGVKEKVKQGLMTLRSFMNGLKLSFSEISLEICPLQGIADTGDITLDLPELFIALAEAAAEKKTGLAIFIDEVQSIPPAELGALIMSMHKMQQKQLPLVLVSAGLPTLPRLAGEAKSYAERLFDFQQVGALSLQDAKEALLVPAQQEGVQIDDAALNRICQHAQGYPYFLQVWGYQTWNNAKSSPIGVHDIEQSELDVLKHLDSNFFLVRYDRLSDSEKRFMRAMAQYPQGQCKSSDLQKELGIKSTSLTPTRAKLVNKGMVYSPRHGVLDYSVPMFGDFMRRVMPNDDWRQR
ncbi:MAG: ATP-binding protein [Akkermansia sp.]